MKLHPAIEVRDEQGVLLGLIAESALPDQRWDGCVWAVPVLSGEVDLAIKTGPVFLLEYRHVRLEWARYRCLKCIYWAVRCQRDDWPALVTPRTSIGTCSRRAPLGLRGQFLGELFSRRASSNPASGPPGS